MVRNWGTKCLRNFPKPKLTNMVWGAGLSFSKCHAERKTLYDPFTPGIFDGEEFTKAIKLWTYGYDIYSPHRVYVVHDYHKSQGNPVHSSWVRSPIPPEEKQQGILRMKTICGLPEGMTDPGEALALRRSKYGLGDRRTMDQAIQFSGFAVNNRTSLGNRCGNLDFVPFIEHPKGADYVPRFDPVTFEPLDEPDVGSIYYNSISVLSGVQTKSASTRMGRVGSDSLPAFEHGTIADRTTDTGSREQYFRQPNKFREKREGTKNLRLHDHSSYDGCELCKKIIHGAAIMAIIIGPVTLVMCCSGKCSSIKKSLCCFLGDSKASGKFT